MHSRTCALAAVMAALLLSCGGGDDDDRTAEPPAEADRQAASSTLTGYVELWPDEEIRQVGGYYEVGGDCDGNIETRTGLRLFGEEFTDFEEGAEVTAQNQDGTVVGAAGLDRGEWVAEPTETNLSDHLCRLPFTVEVDDATFYEVEVAGEKANVPADELDDDVVIEVRDR